jgi:adenosylmethionine-8-amino-7-oxononanoate aminotransferase
MSTRFWHPFAAMGSVADAEVTIERGEDVWVFDTQGRRLLDATASLWYANVGHGRREIAQAVVEQMGRIEAYSAFGDFVTRPAQELTRKLAELAPMPDARVFLASGGGDAVDTAAKLSRRYWAQVGSPRRQALISRTAGYHGTHGYGTSLGGIAVNREGVGDLMPTVQIPHDSASALAEAIETHGEQNVAAFFLEPVIGAGGVYPPVQGYIEEVAAICAQTGVLLIVDAVICGFGRLGTWFGIERWPSVQPDMICFAKGVTSGYLPLGGVVVGQRVSDPFFSPGAPTFRHGATYAGHAACCAAALANLEIMEREDLVRAGAEHEQDLLAALLPLGESPLVAEVRGGVGTMAAIELSAELLKSDAAAVGSVAMAVRRHGVIVRSLGRGLAVSPPLTATPEHFAMIAQAIGRALADGAL